jgi:hypothetical protein
VDTVEEAMTIPARTFRLRPFTKRGNASTIPEVWTRYSSAEDARAAAKRVFHDERVARVMLVVDSTGTFVEWIDR